MAKEIVHEDFGEKIRRCQKMIFGLPAACTLMTCWG